MKKPGFLLIECSIALILLAALTGTYAWYLWQSMALQATMTTRMQYTTAMSNYIESLYGDGASIGQPSNDTCDEYQFEVKSQISLPIITGPWSRNAQQEKIEYRPIQLQATWPCKAAKGESCTWYAGIFA